MKNAKNATPEWVKNQEAWDGFIHHFFGRPEDAADMYGCLGSVARKMLHEGLCNPHGLSFESEDAWALHQVLHLQQMLGHALGVLDEAGAVVPKLV